ncbi:high affinity cationic amino acid transporter 1 [Dendroctonus ponderosae]|uniref:high affinity cationic amino acid transporter 1 n=1 Tax=Dendroctonus ponderosae TaxID=77166 RepID=UPI002035B4CE|nr:high affinity cationic amino acid transporter 1 [Dendroctonus ponderosae]
MARIWTVMTRKKSMDPVAIEESRLARVLNTFDLTALGVGSTLGVGIYVLAGQVARTTAGPSVVLSFLLAAIASLFAGLCYAEFGARVPRAGSAYVYSYVCVGEFVAFVIGWNLILEYIIGSASVARGLSLYLDTLLNNTMQDTFRQIAPIHVDYLASYFDFFSFGVTILLAVALAFGLKESSMANNVVTCLNVAVVLFIIVAGSLQADPANWSIAANSTNATVMGAGGFFPWGVEGMIKGAATCFYGFVGFDCIATTGEEVRNPRRAIPVSIIVSLLVIFLAYFGVSTVLTLMVPYYLQDINAPIPIAFEAVGWTWAKWIVVVGALFGLCASLFGAMFPLPRIIYAMGSDGLVFRVLAKVHPRFQTPVVGSIVAGLITGLMSALFDLNQLINMMSIGTLQAYTIVAASVLLLRYNGDSNSENFQAVGNQDGGINGGSSFTRSLKYLINCSVRSPSQLTQNIVAVEVLLYCLLSVGVAVCAIYLQSYIASGELWAIVLTSTLVGLTAIVLLSMGTQPQSRLPLSFKVPLVPFVPAISILVNVYLMLMLDYRTWVRFAVWMALGLPMYYICACIPKATPSPKSHATNFTNGHAKQETRAVQSKKKAAPPPPTMLEPLEVQQEDALAHLDRVLDTEADRLSNCSGKMSNVSAVASRSESVVADVHCPDVVSLVAGSEPIPHLLSDTPSLDSGIGDSTPNLIEAVEPLTEEAPSGLDNVKSLDNVEVAQAVEKPPIHNVEVAQEDEDEDPPVDNVDDMEREEPDVVPIPPSEPVAVVEPFTDDEGKEAPVAIPAVLSADYLKTVNLRHVQTQLKELEPEGNPNASDNNLKVGSAEYQNFIRDLNSRLQRSPVSAAIYVPASKPTPAPTPIAPNENVLEEPIDRRDATEKLRSFYAAKNDTPDRT